MKYVITESRIKEAIVKFLDSNFTPDGGWEDVIYSMDELEEEGLIDYYVNGDLDYSYFVDYETRDPQTLELDKSMSDTLNSLFGKLWIQIFVEWFEEKTNLEVKILYFRRDPFPPKIIEI